uniref:N/A n=1 Tax=Ganoderma boninense TaxID=34458 RepID=A0A5K1K1K2_9APHY|nr:N/A [Ganoderma boninense]
MPQLPPGQDLASTGAGAQRSSFVAQEGFEAGSKSRQLSGQSTTESVMVAGHSGLVSLSSPAPGYDWNKKSLSRGFQNDPLNPQGHSSAIHTADPGASFMVPFRSEATYQHIAGFSSPEFRANAAQWSAYQIAYPRSIREAELLAKGVNAVPAGPGGSQTSSRASTTVVPAAIPPAQKSNVPDCLTAGSAYLYRLFHERLADAPPTAPPETPHLDSAMYMAGLTRPSGTTDGRGASQALSSATLLSTSAPLFSSVLGYSGYPVAYQLRFSDLVHLSKNVRGSAEGDTVKVEGPSASTVVSETVANSGTSCRWHTGRERLTHHGSKKDPVLNEASMVHHGLDQSTSDMEPSRSQFLRIIVDAASDVAREEGETEDEHEVATPCDTADMVILKGKGKEKLANTQVVIVEVTEVDGA